MVVVRHYILNALAVLVLLCACSPVSYGLATDSQLAAGILPDPSVVLLVVSTLVSAALCRRVNRRIATGF